LISNSGKSSVEVFQTVFGKEKPGRMCCHGRATTSSILKRNKEAEMEKKHAAMEAKHNKEMAAMEGKLHMLLKFMLKQRNSSLDVGDLVGFLSTPNNINNEVCLLALITCFFMVFTIYNSYIVGCLVSFIGKNGVDLNFL
jgi:hypothetical protein